MSKSGRDIAPSIVICSPSQMSPQSWRNWYRTLYESCKLSLTVSLKSRDGIVVAQQKNFDRCSSTRNLVEDGLEDLEKLSRPFGIVSVRVDRHQCQDYRDIQASILSAIVKAGGPRNSGYCANNSGRNLARAARCHHSEIQRQECKLTPGSIRD